MLAGKTAGTVAIVTPLWFLAVYLVMASLSPGYSHLTKAVSELGSWGAPHMWWWNVLGYVLPGVAIALLGASVNSLLGRGGRVVSYALIASGLLMAFSGVFPGNFEDRHSPSMLAHLVSSLGSYVAFLVAGFALPVALRASPNWPRISWPSLTLVLMSLVTGALRSGGAPGLGQRLTFACFFLWVALVGAALVRADQPHNNSFKPKPLRGSA